MGDEAAKSLPYRIACLCYLYEESGRLLLLHRLKPPNQGLYSPIGGKLRMEEGESPAACALREIEEEAGLKLGPEDIHLTGLISEAGYEGSGHWLMFLYEVTRPVEVPWTEIREGRLEWHAWDDIAGLNVPESDRKVIYPLIQKYHGRFFHAHIDCHDGEMHWRLEHADGG
jgi:8-oxo-dGTP diphosphatase